MLLPHTPVPHTDTNCVENCKFCNSGVKEVVQQYDFKDPDKDEPSKLKDYRVCVKACKCEHGTPSEDVTKCAKSSGKKGTTEKVQSCSKCDENYMLMPPGQKLQRCKRVSPCVCTNGQAKVDKDICHGQEHCVSCKDSARFRLKPDKIKTDVVRCEEVGPCICKNGVAEDKEGSAEICNGQENCKGCNTNFVKTPIEGTSGKSERFRCAPPLPKCFKMNSAARTCPKWMRKTYWRLQRVV